MKQSQLHHRLRCLFRQKLSLFSLFKDGQATLEYVLITTLVCMAIFVMGPYVIRSINAHFKTLDEDIEYAVHEPLRQGPPTGYQFPTCDCTDFITFVGCGNGLDCPRRREIWGRTCDPFGCETQFFPELPMRECRDNPPERFADAKCCEDVFFTGNCGSNAVNVPGRCPQGEAEMGQRCGSPDDVMVTEYWCDGIRNEACIFTCIPSGVPKDGPPGTPPPRPANTIWCTPHPSDPQWPDQSSLVADRITTTVDPGGCTGANPCEAECIAPYFKWGVSQCYTCPAGLVMPQQCASGNCVAPSPFVQVDTRDFIAVKLGSYTGQRLCTYDDYRGGGVNGVSTAQSISAICSAMGMFYPGYDQYACGQYAWNGTVGWHNGGPQSPCVGQGWCDGYDTGSDPDNPSQPYVEGVDWVTCRQNMDVGPCCVCQ